VHPSVPREFSLPPSAPAGPSGTCLAPLWGASQSHGLWPWSVTISLFASTGVIDGLSGATATATVSWVITPGMAQPTLTATATPAIRLGATAPTISDTADLEGGSYETGSIVFQVTGPGGFSYTQTDPVSGDGTYSASTPLPTTGTVAGTYTWSARYSGD